MRKYVLAMAAALAAFVALVVPASAAPAVQDVKLLHSFGYKNLLLGMSAKQAEATGLIKHSFTFGSCDYYEFVASEGEREANVLVGIHQTGGVQHIDATHPMKTLRGIGYGSTRAQLVAAYPNLVRDPNNQTLEITDAPLNPEARFGFAVGFDDTVGWMILSKKNALC